MCGSSKSEQVAQQSEQGLSDLMMADFRQRFADQTSAIAQLNEAYDPTIAAGPDQQGMGANELAADNTAIINQTGQNYANAKAALQTTLDARGGGNVALPSGTEGVLQEALASKEAGQQSAEQLALTQQNYALGRQRYQQAVAGKQALLGVYDPTAYGKGAGSGYESSFQMAHTINQENNQEVADITGAAVGAGIDAATFGAGALGGGGFDFAGGLANLTRPGSNA